jgi:hypothetical protein
MPDQNVQPLRLPRLVTGTLARCRTEETVAVWDDVPVALPRADESQAPVTFHQHGPSGATAFRAHGGKAYVRIAGGSGSPAAAWAKVVDQVVPQLMFKLGMGPASATSNYFGLYGWERDLAGANRKRGILETGDEAFKEIRDDGRRQRSSAAARLAGRMLAIGDELWFQADLPRTRISTYNMAVTGLQRSTPVTWESDGAFGAPWDAGCFRIDRPEEAARFSAELGAKLGYAQRHLSDFRLEVVDAAALDALYADAGGDELLGLLGVASSIGQCLRADLGRLSEDDIVRYAGLLTSARKRDVEGMHAWMDANLDGIRDAFVSAAGANAPANLPHIDAAILRYRSFEVPSRNLASGDEAALLSL